MRANLQLQALSGQKLTLAGRAYGRVRLMSKGCILPLNVMEKAGCIPLGRDWFEDLPINLRGIYQVDRLPHPDGFESFAMHLLYDRHGLLFDDDVSGCTGSPLQVDLLAEATPRFSNLRPVPLALWTAVVDKVQRLEQKGTIESVQHSEWVIWVSLVRKKDGSIRVCGDYRRTVSAVTRMFCYLRHTPEEVLAPR